MRTKQARFNINLRWILLAALLVVMIGTITSLTWLRTHKKIVLDSQHSQAATLVTSMHWPHGTVPFTFGLINSASPIWADSINNAARDWSGTGVVTFRTQRDYPVAADTCDLMWMKIRVCSFVNKTTNILAYSTALGFQDHFYTASISVNEAYYVYGTSMYNSAAWRNQIMCSMLGSRMGSPIQIPSDGVFPKTCLLAYFQPGAITPSEHPDDQDYLNMQEIYNHVDAGYAPSVSPNVDAIVTSRDISTWGTLVQASADNSWQVYASSLPGGYTVYRSVLLDPTKK